MGARYLRLVPPIAFSMVCFAQEPPPVRVGERMPGAAAIAAADLDRDGLADVIVGHRLGLTVLRGQTQSRLELGRPVPQGCAVESLAVADFNLDGKSDVAALCTTLSTVLVLPGDGAGNFGSAISLAVSSYDSRGLLALDLNRDGVPDLAVAQFNGVALFAGNGDGTFRPAGELATSESVLTFAVADFDNDGFADLAAADGNLVRLWRGARAGGFERTPISSTDASSPINAVAVADLNGDGRMDLAAACYGGVIPLLGSGDGAFTAAPKLTSGMIPLSLAAGDVNSDGIADLVYGAYYGGTVGILAGNGDGTFTALESLLAPGDVPAVALADLNGDGVADLLAASTSSDSALVAFGRGGGTFESPGYYGAPPFVARAADWDRDGNPDLAVVATYRKEIYLLRRGRELTTLLPVDGYPVEARFADFNGDAIPDLIVAALDSLFQDESQLSIRFLAGTADGFQAARLAASTPYAVTVPSSPPAILVGEFTGDKTLDFVLTNNAAGMIEVYAGSADGGFRRVAEAPANTWSATAADFDGDGIDDVAVAVAARSGQPTGSVFFGAAGGRFRETKTFPLCYGAGELLAVKLRNAATNDLVANCGSEITVLLNAGGGAFQSAPTIEVPEHTVEAINAADFDRDGLSDLVLARRFNDVWGGGLVLASNGDGTFRDFANLALPPAPVAIDAQHWDDDGQLDVAAICAQELTVTIHHTRPAASPAMQRFVLPAPEVLP